MTREMVIDSFAGGGGASTGIEMALGRSPDIAINHDAIALTMHAANHPHTRHVCKSVYDADPLDLTGGLPVGLLWASPDCTHFSKARGGKPVSRKIRDLAWVVIDYAKKVKPRVIILENVEEFRTWGPLKENNMPDEERSGETFQKWLRSLRRLSYEVEWRELRACDYGAPTTRKRLFLIARRDGEPIVWPEPTHARADKAEALGLRPWRTAAEIIDWSLPCPSIFERSKPLAPNTMARIFRGIKRFVLEAEDPFIIGDRAPHVTKFHSNSTGHAADGPLHTITSGGNCKRTAGAPHAMGLVSAHVSRFFGQGTGQSADDPIAALTSQNKSGLVSATMVSVGYGERKGQAPRVPGLDKPVGTVVAGGGKHALVAAHLAKHYGNGVTGTKMDVPLGTVTSVDHHSLVASHLTKFRPRAPGHSNDEPVPTIVAGGNHLGEVRAFLTKYYHTGSGQDMRDPIHTLTTKARMGLVTVHGQMYQITDIGLRMLSPRELFLAQGFPPDYVIDFDVDGKPLSGSAQVRMCGNSVSPPVACALVRANCADMGASRNIGLAREGGAR